MSEGKKFRIESKKVIVLFTKRRKLWKHEMWETTYQAIEQTKSCKYRTKEKWQFKHY